MGGIASQKRGTSTRPTPLPSAVRKRNPWCRLQVKRLCLLAFLVSFQFSTLFRLTLKTSQNDVGERDMNWLSDVTNEYGAISRIEGGREIGGKSGQDRCRFRDAGAGAGAEMCIDGSPSRRRPLVVDILSIGSIERTDMLEAQRETFGRHIIVRNFFNFTEVDDADPACAKKLTPRDAAAISRWCKQPGRWDAKKQFVMNYWQGPYASARWLAKKQNPQGWLCAQTRPAQAYYDTVRKYQSNEMETPDYLVVMDDDTYMNMDIFQDYFTRNDDDRRDLYSNSSIPMAIAGCMVRSPVRDIHLTIPFGGYGMILSKGYIQRTITPIHCNDLNSAASDADIADTALCRVIRDVSPLKEAALFSDGMTIAELVYVYATNQPYPEYKKWKVGFCLHSDWMWGVITNFYNISRHNVANNPHFHNIPQERMEAYFGSELYAGNLKQGGRGNCDHQRSYCHSLSPVCHYTSPEQMHRLAERSRERNPTNYKPRKQITTKRIDVVASNRLVIDVISIGSSLREAFHQAQFNTIGRHKSVRHFTRVNELDHPDPNCLSTFGPEKQANLHRACQNDANSNYGMLKKMEGTVSPGEFCRQGLVSTSLLRAIQQYNNASSSYPDYVMVIYDDTYVNIEAMHGELLYRHPKGGQNGDRSVAFADKLTSRPLALAGCERREGQAPFAFPEMQYGLVLNRDLLRILGNPLHCRLSSGESGGGIERGVCDGIRRNEYHEKDFFKDGMSLVELLHAMVPPQGPTTSYINEGRDPGSSPGACYQANWLLGMMFASNYGLNALFSSDAAGGGGGSSNVTGSEESVGSSTILDAYGGSRHVGMGKREKRKNLCENVGHSQCRSAAMYCAGIEPRHQMEYSKHNEQLSPSGFDSAEEAKASAAETEV